MKFSTIVLVSCLLATAYGGSIIRSRRFGLRSLHPNGRIVGGQNTDISAVPWQLQLEESGFQFCGASIISAQYVLTAAHCTDGASASSLTVRSGTSRHASGGDLTKVASIAQNPQYNSRTTDYDVSVLRLSGSIPLGSNAKAISLASSEPAAGVSALVSGWGTLSSGGSQPAQLQSVKVPTVSRSTCNNAYDDAITARMICAGEAGKDSCQGDSGGPLVANNAQVGIVSWGYGCAEAGYPGVYSSVAALRSFIDNNSEFSAKWV